MYEGYRNRSDFVQNNEKLEITVIEWNVHDFSRGSRNTVTGNQLKIGVTELELMLQLTILVVSLSLVMLFPNVAWSSLKKHIEQNTMNKPGCHTPTYFEVVLKGFYRTLQPVPNMSQLVVPVKLISLKLHLPVLLTATTSAITEWMTSLMISSFW